MREKALYSPRQRGGLTGDKLLMLFKLVNELTGYEDRFANVTVRRLGYWRALFHADAPPVPPLGDELPGPLIDPSVRHLRALLTGLLKTGRNNDGQYVVERIFYVCIIIPDIHQQSSF